jgi:hypothetical protein
MDCVDHRAAPIGYEMAATKVHNSREKWSSKPKSVMIFLINQRYYVLPGIKCG